MPFRYGGLRRGNLPKEQNGEPVGLDPTSPLMIFESNPSGHRLVYVGLLAEAAVRAGATVVLGLSPRVLQSEEFKIHLEVTAKRCVTEVMDGAVHLRDLWAVATVHGVEHMVLPDGDLYITEALRSWPGAPNLTTSVLVMRDPNWELAEAPLALRPRIKAGMLKLLSLRRAIRVVYLREPGHVARNGVIGASDPVLVPDPDAAALGAASLRASIGLDRATFWFGVVGALSSRKNVDLVADALVATAQRVRRPVGLALLGPVSGDAPWSIESISAICNKGGIGFAAESRTMTNEGINRSVAALDCVVVAYSSFAPNSTLGKAASLGTPIIVAGPRSVRRFAKAVTGREGVELTLPNLVSEMVSAIDSPKPTRRVFDAGQFENAILGTVGS